MPHPCGCVNRLWGKNCFYSLMIKSQWFAEPGFMASDFHEDFLASGPLSETGRPDRIHFE